VEDYLYLNAILRDHNVLCGARCVEATSEISERSGLDTQSVSIVDRARPFGGELAGAREEMFNLMSSSHILRCEVPCASSLVLRVVLELRHSAAANPVIVDVGTRIWFHLVVGSNERIIQQLFHLLRNVHVKENNVREISVCCCKCTLVWPLMRNSVSWLCFGPGRIKPILSHGSRARKEIRKV
jgi:hypothetical protein